MTVSAPTLAELSAPAIARFKRMAVNNGRLSEDVLQDSDETLLQKLRLIEHQELKRAAVLLFHSEPECVVSNAYIKIGFFEDDHANLLHHDEVHGCLFDQVFNTLEVLKLKYFRARVSYEGIVRREHYPVPLEALREALLNAVVHKDYASATPIQISVYPDKLMIWNPGELPENWSIETLLGKHSSRPFNPDIANTFFRSGLIESWGRGIERMFRACEEANTPAPEWEISGGDFWTIFHFANSDKLHHLTDPVTDPVTDPAVVHSTVDRLLLLLQQHALFPKELQAALGLKHRPTFRANYLYPALKQKLIAMTLPDKPTSPKQTYQLTELGKIHVQQLLRQSE